MLDEQIPVSSQPEWMRINSQILYYALQGGSVDVWKTAFTSVLSRVFSEYAYSHFDLITGRAHAGLLRLDDLKGRIDVALDTPGSDIADMALKQLLDERLSLNSILKAAGKPDQSGAQLRSTFIKLAWADPRRFWSRACRVQPWGQTSPETTRSGYSSAAR